MKFKVLDHYIKSWIIMSIEENPKVVARFPIEDYGDNIARALAHDYCEFMNDKYHDKNINEEWGSINRSNRIKYHLEQLMLLNSKKRIHWNKHGNGVE